MTPQEEACAIRSITHDGRVAKETGKSIDACPFDAAHQTHRGMGGNPKLDRTTRYQVVALCRRHHGMWDADLIDLQPISDDGFDGLVALYERDKETGLMRHIATETRIGESIAVGA